MDNLFVYLEIEDGVVAEVSLELLTKGRSLANQLGCKVEAIAAGNNLNKVEEQIFPYGVDVLHIFEDERLSPYTTLPHTSIL
ncbi:MAG: electron transfer flavoprotein subunit alpha, partial [Fermentimonas sp.]|nr:electron transfer flavoprotein subunit alpha [Fermentimonas sp.]MDD4698231.1 electron transfer flavoprotein subunit alpha [Fermentimonas sp.]